MTKQSSSFQRDITITTLKALIMLLLLISGRTVSNIDLSTAILDPAQTGFKITGYIGTPIGESVSTVGDINNDGYEDIIVGAKDKGSSCGTVSVIYGGPASSLSNMDLDLTTLDPATTGFTITGNAAGDLFGWSASGAGDINNDGYDDIIVGAYGKGVKKGAAYVIYGGPKSSMSNIDLSTTVLNPLSTGFMITGKAAGDYFALSAGKAGDINNDGYNDIIVGAPGASAKGEAYVIYGGPKSSMANIDLSLSTLDPATTGFTITGNAAGDQFGQSVSRGGDINGDGYGDIIIGAYQKNSGQGAVYVIYGGPESSMSNIDLSMAVLNPLSTGFIVTGNAALNMLGSSVSTAGDINHDGYDDIVIGASAKSRFQGASYVIYGGPKASMSNIDLSLTTLDPATTGFIITGNAAFDFFGSSVSTAGDINHDGYDDIIVGAFRNNDYHGAAYVIYGGPKSSMLNIDLSMTALNPLRTGFTITGSATNDWFGRSVSTAGDINNDGYKDIIVGALCKNSPQGAAYVIYGGPKPSNREVTW